MDLVHVVGIGVIAFYHINGGTNWNNNAIALALKNSSKTKLKES